MYTIRLCFKGGGENPPVDTFVIVDVQPAEFSGFMNTLSDSFSSYMENVFDETSPTRYKDAVKDVMDACGHAWGPHEVPTIEI